jgi:SAM-dependent methyltransferase
LRRACAPIRASSFDHAACVSVLEHIAGDGDARTMAEIWRVLKPGGILHVTTNVARVSREIWNRNRPWGAVQAERDGLVFFERHYAPDEVSSRLLGLPWDVLTRAWVTESLRWVEDAFVGLRPLSFVLGRLLRLACPGNFRVSDTPELPVDGRFGVVYLRLRKPEA